MTPAREKYYNKSLALNGQYVKSQNYFEGGDASIVGNLLIHEEHYENHSIQLDRDLQLSTTTFDPIP